MCRGLCQCFTLEGDGDMAGTWHQLTVARGGAQWGSVMATGGPLASDHSTLDSDSMEPQFHCVLCCGEDRSVARLSSDDD